MKNFLPCRAIYCRSLPLSVATEVEKKDLLSPDVSEVHNFINRKKNPCQSLSAFKLVNLFA
jgi:hypothetical protein